MLLLKYLKKPTCFRGFSLKNGHCSFSIKPHKFSFICIHTKAYASRYLLLVMWLGFCLGWRISRKSWVIYVVCITQFYDISSVFLFFFFVFSLRSQFLLLDLWMFEERNLGRVWTDMVVIYLLARLQWQCRRSLYPLGQWTIVSSFYNASLYR